MVAERRRRKKARIQESSSSEDESSNAGESPSASELSELSASDNESGAEAAEEAADGGARSAATTAEPRELLHKMPHNSNTEFNQIFLKLVTEQFGDDLAALRQSNDFTPASIAQLVAGLKQGVDIFSPEQQRMLSHEKLI